MFCGHMGAQSSTPAQRAPEPMTTATALDLYVRGDRAVVTRNAPIFLPPIWNISDDLARLPKTVSVAPTITLSETNRAIAAFAVESARALETQSPTNVCQMIGAARTRWLPAGSKDEFAHRWHLAAIATLLRSDCVAAMDQAVTAALADFPTEPRFRLARVVVSEQQVAGAVADGKRPSGRDLRDAETRVKLAMAFPTVAAEAALRWSRINALVGDHEHAIGLAAEASASTEVRVQYLAHLFRGWSLAAGAKLDEADSEYGRALALVPDAQSATLARAAAAFRKHDTDRAEQLVTALTSKLAPVDDPWWLYSIGDGRLVDRFIQDMRQVIR